MRNTSTPTISGPFGPGGTVGEDFVSTSGVPAQGVRRIAGVAEDYTTILISSGTNKLFLEPSRDVYRLDTEAGALTVDLTTIEGGVDGQRITILQSDLLHAIVVKDDADADADDQLVVPGGDFTLAAGDIVQLQFKASLSRWFEVGRYWPSETYVDPAETPAAPAIFPNLANIHLSTYKTVQDLMDLLHFAGWISGGAVTDAGGETIDVAIGTGLIRATDSSVALLLFFDWAASSGIAIPTDTTRYVGIEYNSGAPQVVLKTTNTWDFNTDFPLTRIINTSGTLAIASIKTLASQGPKRENRYTLMASGPAVSF